jgi:hypothetical protein
MKVRCRNNFGLTKLEVGKIYEGELKFNEWLGEDRWYIKGLEGLNFKEQVFEIVKDDSMKKTFREVIADIKDGEVWESVQDCYQLKEISCIKGMINFRLKGVLIEKTGKSNVVDTGEGSGQTFKLQKRKEYSFEEAFKAYEEGREIESKVSDFKYKKGNRADFQASYFTPNKWNINFNIDIEEIRGKWYINN